MDEQTRLIERFRNQEIDAETLVRKLAALRAASDESPGVAIDLTALERKVLAPQGSLSGDRQRRAQAADLIPDIEIDEQSLPESVQRAKDTLRRINRYR